MKCQIPEISWHNRDPVLSVDFQPKLAGSDKHERLASSGSDSHVLIWYVSHVDGAVRLDLAADLTRHNRAVNCVRWSPSGEILASCDDESYIVLWKLKPESETVGIFDRDDGSDADKETWIQYKVLRGHMEDVYDLSWSQDSQFLISGSVDNTAIVWDVHKASNIAIMKEHKGFVQGVAWDPLNKYLATLSTDRYLRLYDVYSKKIIQRTNKSIMPVPKDNALAGMNVRLFHDDTLQTFFRRLSWSPDGTLLVVPSGVAELDGSSEKPLYTTYIYTRNSLKEPAVVLPSPDQYTVAVRFCPILFELRESKSLPVIPLQYRMIFALATKCSVYLYDTQQKLPFGLISNIHYTRLTDLAWSNNGSALLVSSTDGYCSIVQFGDGELGKVYEETSLQEIIEAKTEKEVPKKKKKAKKAAVKKPDETEKLAADEKENEGNPMEVDLFQDEICLTNLPESIKEKIPVDNIIKSTEIFSPEKQNGLPTTPIQIRKFPRNRDEIEESPLNDDAKAEEITTPKGKSLATHKTPTRIEVRRQPSSKQPHAKVAVKDCDVEMKIGFDSIDHIKIPSGSTTPKTPRRVELKTVSTPKSKKKLL